MLSLLTLLLFKEKVDDDFKTYIFASSSSFSPNSNLILHISQSSSIVSSDVESFDLNEYFFCFSSDWVDLVAEKFIFYVPIKGYKLSARVSQSFGLISKDFAFYKWVADMGFFSNSWKWELDTEDVFFGKFPWLNS